MADTPPDRGPTAPRSGRRRSRATQLLIVALCAATGFAGIAQAQHNEDPALASLRQDDLVRLLDELTQRNDELATERQRLRQELGELRSQSTSQQSAREAAAAQARTYGVLAGTLPAAGPGIELRIADPDGKLPAHTLVTVLEELRNAGAEAIELNDIRIVAQSWIVGTDGDIVVDGERVTGPYLWRAIGDPDTLAPALNIAGGALAAVRNNGGEPTVTPFDRLEISAVRTLPEPRYAEPVEEPTAEAD